MKSSKAIVVLSLVVSVLSAIAAGTGVFWHDDGKVFQFTSLRGETISMHGDGLYRYESVSGAAQVIAGDIVTLCVGIPLLLISMVLFARGSLKGKLLLAGTLGYFLYTYASVAFLAAYNNLFLVYVALFSASLLAFVLTLMSVQVDDLPAQFNGKFPHRLIAGVSIFVGATLVLMWSGRIVPALVNNVVPEGLESYTTLVIQVLDLGVVAPAALLSGILLLKKAPYGYLLSCVMLIKGATMGTAITAMIVGQLNVGDEVSPVLMVIFPLFTLAFVGATALMLRSIAEPAEPATSGQLHARGA